MDDPSAGKILASLGLTQATGFDDLHTSGALQGLVAVGAKVKEFDSSYEYNGTLSTDLQIECMADGTFNTNPESAEFGPGVRHGKQCVMSAPSNS